MEEEEKCFKKSLLKHKEKLPDGTDNPKRWVAILDDRSPGSWGAAYGYLNLRSNVDLKDKCRNLSRLAAPKKKQRASLRKSQIVKWSKDEEDHFKSAMEKHGERVLVLGVRGVDGRWAAISDDRAEGTWGAKYGVKELRTTKHLQDKARSMNKMRGDGR